MKMKATFFTCGWKPVLSWICVFSIAWINVFMPVIDSVCQLYNIPFDLPSAKDMPTTELIFILLGMGGIHSYDRMKGVVGIATDKDDNEPSHSE